MGRRDSVLFVLGLGLCWGVADQYTKWLAVTHLTTLFPEDSGLFERVGLFYGVNGLYPLALPPVEIVPPVWNHVYVQNPAGAFGLLNSAPLLVRRLVFTGVACVAAIGILWMASKSGGPGRTASYTRWALALVFGGALGNLTDRIAHGYVIDFVDWHWKKLRWPAFNVADVGIVLGVFALVFLLNRRPAKDSEAEGEPPLIEPEET